MTVRVKVVSNHDLREPYDYDLLLKYEKWILIWTGANAILVGLNIWKWIQ